MAQFDIYRRSGSAGLLLDCQVDLLSDLPTRFLIPLLPATSDVVSSYLNPRFSIDGADYVLAPQLALSAPLDRIGKPIGSLAPEHYEIIRAIDLMLGGV